MKLITFGCSNTYGHGLPDCIKNNGDPRPYPSRLSWPKLLAAKLGLPVENLAVCGSSNKQIWQTVMDAKISKQDTVVILWTYIERYAVFMKEKTKMIGPWNKDKTSKAFYKQLYDEKDAAIDLLCRANFVKMHLDRLGVTNQHLTMLKIPFETHWNSVNFQFDLESYKDWPKALDGSHFGIEVHRDIAERLEKILSNYESK